MFVILWDCVKNKTKCSNQVSRDVGRGHPHSEIQRGPRGQAGLSSPGENHNEDQNIVINN